MVQTDQMTKINMQRFTLDYTGFMSDLSLFLLFIFTVWKERKKSLHYAVTVMKNDTYIYTCLDYYGT